MFKKYINSFYNKSLKFIQKFIEISQSVNISDLSKSFAYYVLLALFPLLIFIGNLFAVLKINLSMLYDYLVFAIPKPTVDFLRGITNSAKYSSNINLLIISFIIFLWAMSRVFNILDQGINDIYKIEIKQNFIVRKLFSVVYTFFVLLIITIVLIFCLFSQVIIDFIAPYLNIAKVYLDIYYTLKWPIVILILFGGLFFIYYYFPKKKITFKEALPGVIFTTFCWICLSQIFKIYLNFFGNKWNSYGTIGAVIVFLLWLNMVGEIVIYGGVLNATINRFKFKPQNY